MNTILYIFFECKSEEDSSREIYNMAKYLIDFNKHQLNALFKRGPLMLDDNIYDYTTADDNFYVFFLRFFEMSNEGTMHLSYKNQKLYNFNFDAIDTICVDETTLIIKQLGLRGELRINFAANFSLNLELSSSTSPSKLHYDLASLSTLFAGEFVLDEEGNYSFAKINKDNYCLKLIFSPFKKSAVVSLTHPTLSAPLYTITLNNVNEIQAMKKPDRLLIRREGANDILQILCNPYFSLSISDSSTLEENNFMLREMFF